MSKDSVSDWDTTAANNTDVGGINIQGSASIANGDNALREIMEQIATYTRRGSDLASAGTLDLDSIDSLFLNVTGTTTVTAVTLTSGHWRIVRATGAFQMTAGASLIVDGSTTVNYTTTAGDYILFEGYGSSVVRASLASKALPRTAAQQSQERSNISAALKGQIYGLTLSNNGTDATNDIDIAAGEAASTETNPVLMVLGSALTKRLDASWAVGTNQGGLDTGSIADTTYHVWLIRRSDTGVVDVLFSTSASSPTMPTNYDQKRRIGSIIRASSAIREFYQRGDRFMYRTAITDRSSTSAIAAGVFTMSVPVGLECYPIFSQSQLCNGAGVQVTTWGDVVGGTVTSPHQTITRLNGEQAYMTCDGGLITNTLGRLLLTVTITSGTLSANITDTYGWYDRRGREA